MIAAPINKVTRNTRASTMGLALAALAVAVLAAAPWWGGPSVTSQLIEVLVYIGLASLWNLLAGYAGLVSVGQQAYVGIGGYSLFALCTLYGISPWLALPLAGFIAAVISLPAAALLFRLRGPYFAIGSWVIAEVFSRLAANWQAMGGGSGTSLPAAVFTTIAPTRQLRLETLYLTAVAFAVLTLILCAAVLRSRLGLALTAIRDNEIAARSHGVSITRTKLIIYVAVAFGTGALGALIFLVRLRISPDAAFSVNDWTALIIFMSVIGGLGSLEGPVIGAVIFFALRSALADLGSLYLIVLGVVAIVTMMFARRGLWGAIHASTGWDVIPLRRRVVVSKKMKELPK
jgi:branched-chain amino acid transport system permease protein